MINRFNKPITTDEILDDITSKCNFKMNIHKDRFKKTVYFLNKDELNKIQDLEHKMIHEHSDEYIITHQLNGKTYTLFFTRREDINKE